MVSFFEETDPEELEYSRKRSVDTTRSIDSENYPIDDDQDIEQYLFEAYW